MATEIVEDSLKEFEKELTCAICLEQYTEPKVLSCLHYYCKKCIVEMALKNIPLTCPVCRKETKTTVGKEDELPAAHFINRLKELHTRLKMALSNEVQCEVCLCSELKAETFCKQCKKFLCKRCMESHSLMKALFEGHEIICMTDAKRLKIEELTSENSATNKCVVHNKSLKIYCNQCKTVICRDCMLIDHKDHTIEFNNVAATKNREMLVEILKPLDKVAADLNSAVQEIKLTEEEIEAQGNDVARDIETHFEELQAVLVRRKEQLLKEVNEKVQEKRKKLNVQSKDLCVSRARVQSILDYTRQCIQHCSDSEIIMVHEDIAGKIQQEIQHHQETGGRGTRPVEEVDIGVELKCADALHKLCETKARVTQVPVAVTFQSMRLEECINRTCEAHIVVTLANGKNIKGDLIVQSQLKALKKGPVTENAVKKDGEGQYTVEYTLKAKKKYELSVLVKRQNHSDVEAVQSLLAYELQEVETGRKVVPSLLYIRK